jgi:site-specific DNA-methyltransferase (adenine-specific)
MKEQKDAPYYVNFSQLRGNMSKDKDKIFSDDFYTFVPRNKEIEDKITDQLYFCFETKNQAYNFLNYIKSKFARFSLSLFKINMQLARGELKAVPWLDFNEEWNDEKLYKKFELSESEIRFIEENIPNYY